MSDNGPQYASQDFQKFCELWGFQHVTSSPGYPQSNGKAESAVKTAKRLLMKAKAAGQDPYLAILDHRNTPSQGLDSSPAQRLLSRRTKTLLPTKATLLRPEVIQVSQKLKNRQQRQGTYYNKSARDLDTLATGDCVRIQPLLPNAVWRLGRVLKPVDGRSYEVQLQSGSVIRRNRRHLRRAPGVTFSDPLDMEISIPSQPQAVRQEPAESVPVPHGVATEHTPRDTGGGDTPVTTRAGRTVVQPQRYKDCVVSCR
uniref:Integrase catalytic domain-containing protein n=1 Tax=Gasterosteus aculeatus aculeatus TaxID=481459 RepID=A0AAQ4QHW3_GASAC